ncbi:hypothetical protein GCM10019059_16050 [Camelimonas fluminis]|uniref:Transglutaminase family protein n=1 Tax=Camelimonas fluminis TaxID=1576911 RepID=A0ABV7UMH3_9HYPH|nr:transglutaminase-like domain-containing protein [Camelimonas fluminis]GHE57417.1 hypothetical protein GCM10019059_16050 [Camelimonas fluminis]
MTEDEIRIWTGPGDYVDSDHPDIIAFALEVAGAAATPRERARQIYRAVRELRYDPYVTWGPEVFRASSVLAAGRGYCVGKAAVMAAACRAVGVPARVAFADVTNHLATPQLLERMGSNIFYWHGFTEVNPEGRWIKVSPTFNASLCDKLGVAPLEFDGENDALMQAFDGAGNAFMAYLAQHGAFHDVPAKHIMAEMAMRYPKPLSRDGAKPDMEAEAAALAAG